MLFLNDLIRESGNDYDTFLKKYLSEKYIVTEYESCETMITNLNILKRLEADTKFCSEFYQQQCDMRDSYDIVLDYILCKNMSISIKNKNIGQCSRSALLCLYFRKPYSTEEKIKWFSLVTIRDAKMLSGEIFWEYVFQNIDKDLSDLLRYFLMKNPRELNYVRYNKDTAQETYTAVCKHCPELLPDEIQIKVSKEELLDKIPEQYWLKIVSPRIVFQKKRYLFNSKYCGIINFVCDSHDKYILYNSLQTIDFKTMFYYQVLAACIEIDPPVIRAMYNLRNNIPTTLFSLVSLQALLEYLSSLENLEMFKYYYSEKNIPENNDIDIRRFDKNAQNYAIRNYVHGNCDTFLTWPDQRLCPRLQKCFENEWYNCKYERCKKMILRGFDATEFIRKNPHLYKTMLLWGHNQIPGMNMPEGLNEEILRKKLKGGIDLRKGLAYRIQGINEEENEDMIFEFL